MEPERKLGNAFLDVVLVGAVGVTFALVIDLVSGNGMNPWLLGVGVATYATFLIAATRLGASPGAYLRVVGRRGQPPS